MSNINPQNINGNYPVAGQDNDSQGFRDNFTNIKNNLTFAKSELEDLQNNAILKSALIGSSLNNDLNNAQIKGAQLLRATETILNLGTLSGAITINWADAHFQYVTTGNSLSLTFSGWPTSGFWTKLRLQITVSSIAHTVTLPAQVSINVSNIQGASGQVITFGSAGVYVFEFTSYDNGATIAIEDIFRNYTTTSSDTIAGNLTVGGFANITSNTTAVSTTSGALQVLGGISTQGNIYAGQTVVAANASVTNGIVADHVNVTGNVLATNLTGVLTTASQTNITSVGNLTSLSVIGSATVNTNLTVGNATTIGTALIGGNVVVGNLTTGGTVTTNILSITGSSTNLGNTSVSQNISVGGNVTVAGNVTTNGNLVINGPMVYQGYQYNAAVTETSITCLNNTNRLILDSAGTIGHANVTLPNSVLDGTEYRVATTQTISIFQVLSATGGNLGISPTVANIAITGPATLTFFWHASENKWYRIA